MTRPITIPEPVAAPATVHALLIFYIILMRLHDHDLEEVKCGHRKGRMGLLWGCQIWSRMPESYSSRFLQVML